MASGNGVHLESEKDVLDANEAIMNAVSNAKEPENSNKVDGILDVSKAEVTQSSDTVTDPKNQNSVKVTVKGSASKTSKMTKNGHNTGTFGRTPRPSLSQSLSFPAKTRTPDSMRASIDAHTKPRVSGPTLSTSASVNRRSSSGLKPIKTALTLNEDDAASSTASPNANPSGGRRNSTSGFPSRLEERAERRKQFYSKVEERVQAKEVEKTNMQAKSKETQDKEIKKLRKSLTFKATPMPDFYKEPPPTPQLKKIPATRPKSPKLGRNKSLLGQVSKSMEQIEIVDSPRSARDQTMSPRFTPTYRNNNTAAFKKPNSKSLTKFSQVKTVKSKEKVLKAEDNEEVHASQVPTVGSLEVEGFLEVNTVQESGNGSSSPNQDMTPGDIVVAC